MAMADAAAGGASIVDLIIGSGIVIVIGEAGASSSSSPFVVSVRPPSPLDRRRSIRSLLSDLSLPSPSSQPRARSRGPPTRRRSSPSRCYPRTTTTTTPTTACDGASRPSSLFFRGVVFCRS
jgi:hypothetical protein